VAEALEEICGDDDGARLGELAHHLSYATAPVDAGKAIDYARRAGEHALAELAPDEALRWLTEALELHGRQPAPDPRRALRAPDRSRNGPAADRRAGV